MLHALLLSLLPYFAPTTALPKHFPHWQAPDPGDARSACPGINALANHGILPRSGRNIDRATLRRAVTVGFNIDSEPPEGFPLFADAVFDIAILTNVDPNNNETFDMDTVSRHDFPYGPIEADGSLSRDDFYSGDQTSFNPNIFAETKAVIDEGLAHGEGTGNGTEIDVPLAEKARAIRMYNQSKRNPDFYFDDVVLGRSLGTSALYLSALGDPVNGVAKAEWMKILFEQERIPFAEGYNPHAKEQSTVQTLAALVAKLQAASPSGTPCTYTPDQAPCPAAGANAVDTRALHKFHGFHGF